MDELLDIYDHDHNPCGVAPRSIAHRDGLWHDSFHCWIVSGSSYPALILQLRGPHKDTFPNMLDISAAGHLLSGEQPMDGLRELEEELGVQVLESQLYPLGIRQHETYGDGFINREFNHTFLFRDDRRLEGYQLQTLEVTGLVSLPLAGARLLFDGESEYAEVEELRVIDGRVQLRLRNITLADLVPHGEAYYRAICTCAAALLAGDTPQLPAGI
jgi:isopentenyldiphosphate isomerase